MESNVLSDREKAAVLWAEHVTLNTARSRDDVFEAVAAQFTEPELVELTLMSGFFNMFNRLMDSLRVDIEPQSDVDKIQRSLHLEPAKVKAYVETILATWPDSFPAPVDER